MRLAFSREIKKLEQKAAKDFGLDEAALMDRAAKHLLNAVNRIAADEIVILCGAGNNGADGYTLASLLREQNKKASVIAVEDARSSLCAARQRAFATLSAPLYSFIGERAICESVIRKADLIVDCVFGTGFDATREAPQNFIDLCKLLENNPAKRISADLPSGLDADRGIFAKDESGAPCYIRADQTITFSYAKPALLTAPGLQAAGEVTVADLSIPKELAEEALKGAFTIEKDVRRLILPRENETSKADYGRLFSYCGSDAMTGAAYLAALGALRSGAGLITLSSSAHAVTVLQNRLSEPVFFALPTTLEGDLDAPKLKEELDARLPKQTAILLGCGIGLNEVSERITRYLISHATCPVVCDADAITILSRDKEFLRAHGEKLILTPHPGEAARLLDASAEDVQNGRIRAAQTISESFHCVTVLKGNRTLISSPDGRLAINLCGNPGMAKAGAGDLLAGILAGFIAQKIDPFDAACLSVYLHARAGDIAKMNLGEASLLPSDMARFLPQAITEE